MTSGAGVSVSPGDARASGERRWQAGLAVRGEQAGLGRGVGGPDAGKMRGRLGRTFGDWVDGKGKEMGHEEEKGNGLGQAVSWVGLGFGFPISLVFSPLFFSKHTQTI